MTLDKIMQARSAVSAAIERGDFAVQSARPRGMDANLWAAYRSCFVKKGYASAVKAQRDDQRCYECDYCKLWHRTSSN